jgi:hypothetical protein
MKTVNFISTTTTDVTVEVSTKLQKIKFIAGLSSFLTLNLLIFFHYRKINFPGFVYRLHENTRLYLSLYISIHI